MRACLCCVPRVVCMLRAAVVAVAVLRVMRLACLRCFVSRSVRALSPRLRVPQRVSRAAHAHAVARPRASGTCASAPQGVWRLGGGRAEIAWRAWRCAPAADLQYGAAVQDQLLFTPRHLDQVFVRVGQSMLVCLWRSPRPAPSSMLLSRAACRLRAVGAPCLAWTSRCQVLCKRVRDNRCWGGLPSGSGPNWQRSRRPCVAADRGRAPIVTCRG